MLEEFVTMVTELVPELMSYSQRAQLIMGLRAKVSDSHVVWFQCSATLRRIVSLNAKKKKKRFGLKRERVSCVFKRQ